MKKIGRYIIIGLVGIYILLYVSYENGYYERIIQEKTIMTEDMIREYENDLANGVDVTKKNYIGNANEYSNVYTKAALQVSSRIETLVDNVIKFVFKKINDVVEK